MVGLGFGYGQNRLKLGMIDLISFRDEDLTSFGDKEDMISSGDEEDLISFKDRRNPT